MKTPLYIAMAVGFVLLIFDLSNFSIDMPQVQQEMPADAAHKKASSSHNKSTKAAKADGSIIWDAPTYWLAGKTASMRIGSYSIETTLADGSKEKADLSIIKLRGNGGGDLPNLNRWRAQVGLAAVAEKEFAQESVSMRGKLGAFVYVKIINPATPDAALLGTMMPVHGEVVYVKLAGSSKAL